MYRIIRWNLSKKASYFKQADAFLVSIPASGRNWIRVFLYSYFANCEGSEFTLDEKKWSLTCFPKVIFTHDLWEHITARRTWDRIRGKHLINPILRHQKPILLLVRDPRDVVVSLYFQLTKRSHLFSGELSEMIRHPMFGIQTIVNIMNTWLHEWEDKANFKMIHYEYCRAFTEKAFLEILNFLGIKEVNDTAFANSLKFSSFDNMKRLESNKQFGKSILVPGDRNDPESYKVRRGKVGGFKEYMNREDICYLEQAMANLDSRFGYGKGC